MPLSDTAIKKSLPADKPYTLTDSGGLYLLVMPTGGKLWRWSYRFEKKERLMALGKYPDVPLAVARARLAMSRAPRTSMAFTMATISGASISAMGSGPRLGNMSATMRRYT